jgi:hypothetical protein
MNSTVASLMLAVASALATSPPDDITLSVAATLGGATTVYDWRTERCALWDVPDAPFRAFRRRDGRVVAFASADTSQTYVGDTLLTIRHSCHSSLRSAHDPDPAKYDGDRFLTSTWTDDGINVFGLVHDEYHADRFKLCVRVAPLACWYNTIIAVASHDGGQTFSAAAPPQVVAAANMKQDAEPYRHRGFFNPSNILKDGAYWYVMSNTTGGGAQKPGLCLFRSDNIANPARWRAWDGKAFEANAIDPYRDDLENYAPCQPVEWLATIGSVSKHKPSDRFLAVFDWPDAEHPRGQIAYSWSKDLIHWQPPRTLLNVPGMSSPDCRDTSRYGYPAVADPNADGRNFDAIGDNPYLFVTEFHVEHCQLPPDRALVRIPLHISSP